MRAGGDEAWPYDLAAALGGFLAAAAAVLLGAPPWFRAPLAFAAVLFAPGYLALAALYPERAVLRRPAGPGEPPEVARGLDAVERVALSIGVSIVVVPATALALANTPLGLRIVPMVLALAGWCLGFAALATWRRLRLPAGQRFRIALPSPGFNPGALLGAALLLALVLAGSAFVHALVSPRAPQPYTEAYLLANDGTAACYPVGFGPDGYRAADAVGCPADVGAVILGLVNHEGHSQRYWVVAAWTAQERLPDNTTRAGAVEEWRTWDVTLEDSGATAEVGQGFDPQYETRVPLPPPPGNGTFRLSFLVFREPPPPIEAASIGAAYRTVHLWIESTAA